MPRPQDTEANEAAGEAIRGAARGAARWGVPLIALSAAGNFMSPIYKNLTIQFKVFLVMSGMVIGGAIHGDRSLRAFEAARREARIRRRLVKDEETWLKWEAEVEKKERNEKKT